MKFRRCGQSGILLPEISLGLWHNFGDVNTFANSQAMAHYAFDRGITHFDLANNYGPSYGSAEETFGMIMKKSFMPYRDELFISTSCRTLESATGEDGIVKATSGWTEIFIYPGYRFKCIDALITNFHLPESTLLMLVSALAGKEKIMHAYEVAVQERYRFFSFGDAMFIS